LLVPFKKREKMKKTAILLGAALFFSGCFFNQTEKKPTPAVQTQYVAPTVKTKQKCMKPMVFEVIGRGVVPCNGSCSQAQAVTMARRSAIIDGYRALAEKIYGIKINGNDTVKNMMLQNSYIRAYVQGLIKGANIEEESFKDGIYKVVMSVKISEDDWKNISQDYDGSGCN